MKTTERDFKIFTKQVFKEQILWGLLNWEIDVEHELLTATSLAEVVFNSGGRTACITLNKEWKDTKVTEIAIKQAAFHEVMHLLIGDLQCLTTGSVPRAFKEELATLFGHQIIRTLENVVGFNNAKS